MSTETRVPLYDRLPEIYRVEDAKQTPPYPLRSFLRLVEDMLGEIHRNVEQLYHDLFIETCDDWVIPYLADLVGASHLEGDPWTLRADVANTIALRRRKGTLGAVEWLTWSLTQWGVHAVELRQNLVWAQHLNHQRPDAGGLPPYVQPTVDRHTVVRGGTAVARDPSTLALLGTAFDPFAHFPDLRPPAFGNVSYDVPLVHLRWNLPNLAIFLWRLEAYTVPVTSPVWKASCPTSEVAPLAAHSVHFEVHPLDHAVRLFNTFDFDPEARPLRVTELDGTPGPIHPSRLDSLRPPMYEGATAPSAPGVGDLWLDTGETPAAWKQWDGSAWAPLIGDVFRELIGGTGGDPEAYVGVKTYDPADLTSLDTTGAAFQLHLPKVEFSPFDAEDWSFRGADLSQWEVKMGPPLRSKEVAIDPVLGRLAIGVDTVAEAQALEQDLLLTYTYGAVGPVGAHPIDRVSEPPATVVVDSRPATPSLADALANLDTATAPVVIEIQDSRIHELDLTTVSGTLDEDGGRNLVLADSLTLRAADGQRPIVRLRQPLRFRPLAVRGATAGEQKALDDANGTLTVRLEGLYLARASGFAAADPLIARAAVHGLEIYDCTLDPGGQLLRDGSGRLAIRDSLRLAGRPFGFPTAEQLDFDGIHPAFKETPEIHLERTVSGPLRVDRDHRLFLTESIVDGGSGVGEDPASAGLAISGAGVDPAADWGPETRVDRVTLFGRARHEKLSGRGGIWTQPLEVLNNQVGCVKTSYFSGLGDRLPQHQGCVLGTDAYLRFVSEIFGQPAYAQLAHASDFRIRERGPDDDAMGAFGFLLEAHKWRNLKIRYRELMPVGVRPLLVPVT